MWLVERKTFQFIHQNGFNIHGIDLSAESIKEASKYSVILTFSTTRYA